MVVVCSICDEEYSAERRPLLLACCKGAALCEECLGAHLRVSNRCPLLCPSRPAVRHFVRQCREASPPYDEFIKTLEARERQREEKIGPSAVKLGKAGLFENYVKSREIVGDADVALSLQMRYEEEVLEKRRFDEDKDLALARRLQEQEEEEKENLRKVLTKRPSDVNSIVVSKSIKNSKVRTLDSFFKPKPLQPNSQKSSLASSSSTSSSSSSGAAQKRQKVQVISLLDN